MEISLIILVHHNDFTLKKDLTDYFEQIILVDNTSKQQLATRFKQLKQVKVIVHPQPIVDFSKVRNMAIDEANQKWVMLLDSDEVISPQLYQSIKKNISQQNRCNKCQGYYIKRQDIFKGKTLQFGEVGHVYKLRLAKKDKIQFVRPIHEVAIIDGKTCHLPQPIYHYAHHSITTFLTKIAKYAYREAAYKIEQGQTFSVFSLVCKPLLKFLYNYIIKLGFLDGYAGFTYAIMMSIHSMIVRISIYEHTTQQN